MAYVYDTELTCSKKITFEIDEDGNLHNVRFLRGCPGNLLAIGKLVEGENALKIAGILEGNLCGERGTSCADQFAKAIRKYYEDQK